MLWNKLTFGTFTPVSGQIKQWWSTFILNIYGLPALSFQSFFALNPNNDFNAWQPALSPIGTLNKSITGFLPASIQHIDRQIRFFVFLILLGMLAYLLLFLTKKQKARAILQTGIIPLFVGSWIQIFSYNSTGYVSPKDWYWLAELVFIIIFVAVLLDILFKLFFKKLATTYLALGFLSGLLCISLDCAILSKCHFHK